MVRMVITNHYEHGDPTIDSDGTQWATFHAMDRLSVNLDGPRQEIKEIIVALNKLKNIEIDKILMSEEH